MVEFRGIRAQRRARVASAIVACIILSACGKAPPEAAPVTPIAKPATPRNAPTTPSPPAAPAAPIPPQPLPSFADRADVVIDVQWHLSTITAVLQGWTNLPAGYKIGFLIVDPRQVAVHDWVTLQVGTTGYFSSAPLNWLPASTLLGSALLTLRCKRRRSSMSLGKPERT